MFDLRRFALGFSASYNETTHSGNQGLARIQAHSSTAGFSVIEVLAATVIAMLMILAIASFQVNISKGNRSLSQKLEMTQFERQLSQVLADDTICTCNTRDLQLTAGPPVGGVPTFTAPFGTKPLRSGFGANCAVANPDRILAAPNTPLAGARHPLPINSIQLTDLKFVERDPITGKDAYSGFISVTIADYPGWTQPPLERPLQPIRIGKKFFVDPTSRKVTECGQAVTEVAYVQAPDPWVNNDALGTTQSSAECPQGMVAIGGGWIARSFNPACPFRYATVLSSQPDPSYKRWNVLVLCREFKAYVSCYKPSFQNGP